MDEINILAEIAEPAFALMANQNRFVLIVGVRQFVSTRGRKGSARIVMAQAYVFMADNGIIVKNATEKVSVNTMFGRINAKKDVEEVEFVSTGLLKITVEKGVEVRGFASMGHSNRNANCAKDLRFVFTTSTRRIAYNAQLVNTVNSSPIAEFVMDVDCVRCPFAKPQEMPNMHHIVSGVLYL